MGIVEDFFARELAVLSSAYGGNKRFAAEQERGELLENAVDSLSLRLFFTRDGGAGREAHLAQLSDVALLKRLRKSEEWLYELCRNLFEEVNLGFDGPAQGRRVRLVDATHVKEPGKTGSVWRIHYSLSWPSLRCDYLKLSAAKGEGNGESLSHLPVRAGGISSGQGGSGYFLFNNTGGSASDYSSGMEIWGTQTGMAVRQNSSYTFSFYLANDNTINNAVIQPIIDGVALSSGVTAAGAGSWEQFSFTWNSGTNTTANLELTDLASNPVGNDFGVDTITLTGLTPLPELPIPALLTLGLGVLGLMHIVCRYRMAKARLADRRFNGRSSSLPYAKDGVDLYTVLAKVRNDTDIVIEDRGSRWLIGQPAKRVEHPNQLPLVTLADEYAPRPNHPLWRTHYSPDPGISCRRRDFD